MGCVVKRRTWPWHDSRPARIGIFMVDVCGQCLWPGYSSLLVFQGGLVVFGFLAYFYLLINSFTPCNKVRHRTTYPGDTLTGWGASPLPRPSPPITEPAHPSPNSSHSRPRPHPPEERRFQRQSLSLRPDKRPPPGTEDASWRLTVAIQGRGPRVRSSARGVHLVAVIVS